MPLVVVSRTLPPQIELHDAPYKCSSVPCRRDALQSIDAINSILDDTIALQQILPYLKTLEDYVYTH